MDTETKLNEAIKSAGGKLIQLSEAAFTAWAEKLDKDVLQLLIETHRGTRNFYKKILNEERRKTNPSSYRYSDAADKIVIYNSQGKIISGILNSKK
jgi:hypothetical protein